MTAIAELSRLEDLECHPLDERLVPPALSLAVAHSLTAYDAAYAALAVQLGGVVVSGDSRFVERAAGAGRSRLRRLPRPRRREARLEEG